VLGHECPQDWRYSFADPDGAKKRINVVRSFLSVHFRDVYHDMQLYCRIISWSCWVTQPIPDPILRPTLSLPIVLPHSSSLSRGINCEEWCCVTVLDCNSAYQGLLSLNQTSAGLSLCGLTPRTNSTSSDRCDAIRGIRCYPAHVL
jgi:hypothetical protein